MRLNFRRWTVDGEPVTAREFHRMARLAPRVPWVPAEVRCAWCRHILFFRWVNLRRGLPFPLWRARMLLWRVMLLVVAGVGRSCKQCRFDREVRGW